MAVITLDARVNGEVRVVTIAAVVEEIPGGFLVNGRRIAASGVHEIRRVRTMRKHCFHCWNNADWLSGGIETCLDHAGEDRVALEGEDLWTEGMHDDR